MKYLFLLPLVILPLAQANQCSVDTLAKYTTHDAIEGEQIVADADNAKVTNNIATLTGDVVAQRGNEIFYSESISYDRNKKEIHTPVEFVYGTPEVAVKAQKGGYSLNTEEGTFYNADYFLNKENANGEAKTININRKKNIEKLTEAVYSTCPRSNRSWSIKAKELTLDHNTNTGTAWHTTFRVADVPIFYLPYYSFPITDERKTGFLTPHLTISERRGIEFGIPYYINIAPNHDATLYPRYMTKRGLMIGGEYRYLLEDVSGYVSASYLNNDKKTKIDRWSFFTKHKYQPNDKLLVEAQYQKVSDKNFVYDFENISNVSGNSYLESYIKGSYKLLPNYTLSAKANEYQVADSKRSEASKPYQLAPQILGIGSWKLDNGLIIKSETEFTNFKKDNVKTVVGTRADQKITLSYPMTTSYGFIKPTASYQFSRYDTKNQKTKIKSKHTRSIPTLSIDAGLFFDRQLNWFGEQATQSLEPRLFYLYTPYHNQSNIPNFDTSKVTLSYNAMFLQNRFTGKDRIGDANQLTTAVSSKITSNETGKELARVSLGQIQYFSDRRVGATSNNTVARSNLIADGSLSLGKNITLTGDTHIDTINKNFERYSIGLNYTLGKDKALRVSHIYNDKDYKQIDVSGVWRFNDNWRAFGRWNYSLDKKKTADMMAGVEYADCCWGVRLLARQYREKLTQDVRPETEFYLEFSLSGLGNIGSSTSSILNDSIPNYHPISFEQP